MRSSCAITVTYGRARELNRCHKEVLRRSITKYIDARCPTWLTGSLGIQTCTCDPEGTSREVSTLAAERKGSPDSLTHLGTSGKAGKPESPRLQTPVPRSREQITESGMDARRVGTASMKLEEETGERPLAGKLPHERVGWPSYAPPPDSFREAPTQPAEGPELGPEELAAQPKRSVGFYSIRPPRHSSIEIPRAPRVPRDLGGFEEHTQTVPVARGRQRAPSVPPSSRVRTDSTYPETIRTPPPDAEIPSQRPKGRSSSPPPPMQEAPTLAPPPPDLEGPRRSSYPAPRIYFAPHVRSQASDWARTGSLSLPGCSSPRHARALQRALLLALLHDPGYHAIPQGLRQRAGWLFCEGWESGSTGHPLRELDDLATVLGLPAGGDSRKVLTMAIAGVLPRGSSNRPRRPSSAPPRR